MPFATWPDALERFVHVLYSEGFTSGFAWSASAHGEGQRLVEDPATLATANLDDLRRVLIAHVRADRFVEGHLLAEYRSGTLVRSCSE